MERPADAPDATDEEAEVLKKLSAKFSKGGVAVQDMSGGCGSFYAIQVTDDAFKGLTKIKQHQLVNSVIKEELARWHGAQLHTRAPE